MNEVIKRLKLYGDIIEFCSTQFLAGDDIMSDASKLFGLLIDDEDCNDFPNNHDIKVKEPYIDYTIKQLGDAIHDMNASIIEFTRTAVEIDSKPDVDSLISGLKDVIDDFNESDVDGPCNCSHCTCESEDDLDETDFDVDELSKDVNNTIINLIKNGEVTDDDMSEVMIRVRNVDGSDDEITVGFKPSILTLVKNIELINENDITQCGVDTPVTDGEILYDVDTISNLQCTEVKTILYNDQSMSLVLEANGETYLSTDTFTIFKLMLSLQMGESLDEINKLTDDLFNAFID